MSRSAPTDWQRRPHAINLSVLSSPERAAAVVGILVEVGVIDLNCPLDNRVVRSPEDQAVLAAALHDIGAIDLHGLLAADDAA